MTRTSATILTICTALLLQACGSSPSVRYYGLQPIETVYRQSAAELPILGIGPLRMPEYLERSQMVTRGEGSEMLVADFHRWAEPLDQAIHRTLASNVDSLVETATVIAFPYNALINVDYRLVGRIERFDADLNGLAVLVVQWTVGESDGTVLLSPRRTRYESRVARPGDPGSNAKAMSDTIAQFSRDIATEFEKAER